MCFYIYAVDGNIEINHASESIELLCDGRSCVIADVLINNSSVNPVKELTILYPNRFYHIDEFDSSTVTGEYDDVTNSLLDRDSPYNRVYLLPGSYINILPSADANNADFIVPSWGYFVEISKPDPTNPQNNITFKGVVGGSNTLLIDDGDVDTLQAHVLNEIHFTIFKCSLSYPIEKDIPRMLRFRFIADTAAHNKQAIEHYTLRKLTNTLHFEYQMIGPYDVRQQFQTYLLSYKRRIVEKNSSDDIKQGVINLIHRFENEGIIGSSQGKHSTIFKNLFLHINPGVLERITDIMRSGDLLIAGFLPNVVRIAPKEVLHIYEWKVIKKPGNTDFTFNLLFQAKPLFIWHTIAPWIAISIAAVGFIINLILNLTNRK